MTHTPAPWEMHHYGDNEGDIHGSNGTLVCMMREGDTAPDQDWSADARLIAAAPELLAALKEIVAYDEGSNDPEDYGYEVLMRCKAAIAKAEGRSE
jgi:hypothetical protein